MKTLIATKDHMYREKVQGKYYLRTAKMGAEVEVSAELEYPFLVEVDSPEAETAIAAALAQEEQDAAAVKRIQDATKRKTEAMATVRAIKAQKHKAKKKAKAKKAKEEEAAEAAKEETE